MKGFDRIYISTCDRDMSKKGVYRCMVSSKGENHEPSKRMLTKERGSSQVSFTIFEGNASKSDGFPSPKFPPDLTMWTSRGGAPSTRVVVPGIP